MSTPPNHPGPTPADPGIREVCALMDRLEIEPSHVVHVTTLALQLFDELQTLHQLSARDRFLLEAAGRLHDIGWSASPSGKAHHKESARLIRENAWKSIPPHDVELIALIARYHRRALPSPEHEDFAQLSSGDQKRVERMAALLRIADALDRSHLQKIRQIKCAVKPRAIEFSLAADRDPTYEIAAAEKKGDLAEQVFGRKLVFISVRS